MERISYTEIPDEFELIDFFESESVESNPSDGFWCYEKKAEKGLKISVSFNILEKSIQTALYIDDYEIEVVSHEGAKKIYIVNDKGIKKLKCECEIPPVKTILNLILEPTLRVRWQSI